MRDWRAYVQERLGSLRQGQMDQVQIANELAGHLEEHYEALWANGLGEDEAFAQTCARAGDWEELRRGIASATQEGTMQDRIRQIWIPVW